MISLYGPVSCILEIQECQTVNNQCVLLYEYFSCHLIQVGKYGCTHSFSSAESVSDGLAAKLFALSLLYMGADLLT